jgi:hypothetical protein
MSRNHLIRVLGAVVVSTALALTGCASAAATTAATTASAAPPAAAHGRANIILYSINSDGPYFTAMVTGAIGDYGPAVTVHPDGTVDPEHTSEMELRLTHGTFRIRIAELFKKIIKVTSHEPIYPRTCSTFVNVAATTPIVPGSGTGSYRGIRGGFTITVTGDEIHLRPCPPSALRTLRQYAFLAGPGQVSIG